MICKRCSKEAIELAGGLCSYCRAELNLDGCGRPRKIEFTAMLEFISEINTLRELFPELSHELDNCLFEVLNNHTPKCGHGNCSCQTMTFEKFKAERNLKFGTTEKSYEFN